MSKEFDNSESAELHINIDKRDLVELKNDIGVVYKPTTTQENGKWDQLKPENDVNKDCGYLYLVVCSASLLAFAAGQGFSWTSPVLPKLFSPDQTPLTHPIDASQASIIAAILCVGAAIGPFPFGYLADKIGRKKTCMIISLPMVVSLVILAFTDQVKIYYAARLLYGVGSGGVFAVVNMYIGEITEDRNRGKFCVYLGIFIALGLLYPFAIGPFLSIKIFCLSCLLPLQMFIIFFGIYGTESPPYLIKNGDTDGALEALSKLRGRPEEMVKRELIDIQKLIEEENKEKGGIAEIFRSKASQKAFIVVAGLLLCQQFSGINAVIGFMETIFEAAGGALSPHVASILVGVIQVLTVMITSSLIEKLGRKILLLVSVFGLAASLLFLGLYFFLHKYQFSVVTYLWWLPVFSLLLYIVSFNLGLGPVPWTLLAEIFASNVRANASALSTIINFGTSFFVTLAFPIISEVLGMAQSFWIFGGCMVIGLIFIKSVVPETKGKTQAEIQQMLCQ